RPPSSASPFRIASDAVTFFSAFLVLLYNRFIILPSFSSAAPSQIKTDPADHLLDGIISQVCAVRNLRMAVRRDSDALLISYLFLCCTRSEEHTSELQSRFDLVCRLLLFILSALNS